MTQDFIDIIADSIQALGFHYRPTMQAAMEEVNLEPPVWATLFAAFSVAPEPIDERKLAYLFPYHAASSLQERVQQLVEGGLLEATDGNRFRLTKAGHKAAVKPIQAAHVVLAKLTPISSDDMESLSDLLYRLVQSALEAPEPREKPHLQRSRLVDPGDDAAAATRIDQYLTDLYFFRDDVHNAAWRSLDVGGHAWDVLTHVWRQEANTVDDLAERLEARGQTRETITAVLEELVDRGWIEAKDDGYGVTGKGNNLRQEAEDATNRVYYAPWSVLTDAESEKINELLIRFNTALAPPETDGE